MAIVAFLTGSIIGTICGLFGWLAFGLTGGQAFVLYLALSLGLPPLGMAFAALRPVGGPTDDPSRARKLPDSHPHAV